MFKIVAVQQVLSDPCTKHLLLNRSSQRTCSHSSSSITLKKDQILQLSTISVNSTASHISRLQLLDLNSKLHQMAHNLHLLSNRLEGYRHHSLRLRSTTMRRLQRRCTRIIKSQTWSQASSKQVKVPLLLQSRQSRPRHTSFSQARTRLASLEFLVKTKHRLQQL